MVALEFILRNFLPYLIIQYLNTVLIRDNYLYEIVPFRKLHSATRSIEAATAAITAISVIIFLNLLQYRSSLPQVKRNLIYSITNLVYKLLHKLPNNDLGYRILGNQERLEKSQIRVEIKPSTRVSLLSTNLVLVGNSY